VLLSYHENKKGYRTTDKVKKNLYTQYY